MWGVQRAQSLGSGFQRRHRCPGGMPPQNRRVLRPHGRDAQEFAFAESAYSGVGGASKWRGGAKRSLGMERHHRGSQRDIKPAAASLLLK